MTSYSQRMYIYAINKTPHMAKIGFGNPEEPHRVSNASRWFFLIVLISVLAASVLTYLFRKDLLAMMGGWMMLFVTLSMSLGIVFAVYRIMVISRAHRKRKRTFQ